MTFINYRLEKRIRKTKLLFNKNYHWKKKKRFFDSQVVLPPSPTEKNDNNRIEITNKKQKRALYIQENKNENHKSQLILAIGYYHRYHQHWGYPFLLQTNKNITLDSYSQAITAPNGRIQTKIYFFRFFFLTFYTMFYDYYYYHY